MKRAVLPIALVGLAFAAGRARTAAAPVTVLVELFTSEGCSSCPPADRLLTELVEQQPVSGARIVGLSEHVDYWDSLGWKDPFSSALFTRRQADYVAATNSSDAYTPQMVIDGVEAIVGSDRPAALAAIARAITHARSAGSIAVAWSPAGQMQTQISAGGARPGDAIYAALTEDGLASSVSRGENAGRTLTHTGVTRRLIRLGTVKRDGSFHDDRRLELDPAWRVPRLRVVVFAQRGDGGSIDACAMGV